MNDHTMNYDNKVFVSAGPQARSRDVPVGHYHQCDHVVWAEIRGGQVMAGRLVGTCDPDGTLHFGYTQVMTNGRVVTGTCTSRPEVMSDGRLRLREEWRRHDEAGSAGVSFIEEVVYDRLGLTSPLS
ncbi:hypothetical protein [Nonomuraea sp. NPDC050783]|uniref:hypothetical protein n=1 Tax=Nonomuraea sp. NPDC050783 TaxID=3154634 RepID=UPI00346709D3